MELNPPASPTTVVTPSPGIFGTKIPSTVSFAVGVLLFFMPFIDIKCNEMSVQTVNGIKLATGFQVKGPGDNNSLFGEMEETGKSNSNKGESKDPNLFALAALALGIAGLLLSSLNNKAGGIGGLITGVLSAAALIGLMVDVKTGLKNEPLTGNGSDDVKISVDFTSWFYIALLAFLAAAYFSYRRMKAIKPPL
jgi:hypothetical protein